MLYLIANRRQVIHTGLFVKKHFFFYRGLAKGRLRLESKESSRRPIFRYASGRSITLFKKFTQNQQHNLTVWLLSIFKTHDIRILKTSISSRQTTNYTDSSTDRFKTVPVTVSDIRAFIRPKCLTTKNVIVNYGDARARDDVLIRKNRTDVKHNNVTYT